MTGAFNNMNKGNVLIYFLYIHLMIYKKNTWSKALNQGYIQPSSKKPDLHVLQNVDHEDILLKYRSLIMNFSQLLF